MKDFPLTLFGGKTRSAYSHVCPASSENSVRTKGAMARNGMKTAKLGSL